MEEKQRKSLIILCSVLGIILALMIGWTVFDRTVDRSGWSLNDGLYSYRDFHGRKVSGWQEIDGGTYYFDENSIMTTGWLEENESRYYFGTDGRMATGWANVEDMRCYFDADGKLHTGWLELDGKQYYLEETGAMVSGWLHLDGSSHYFGENGAMLTGWNQIEGETYFFGDQGAMATGELELEGNHYRFGTDGVMFTGWEETDEGRRYYAEDGAQAFDWAQIGEDWYFFGEEGLTRTGWYQEGEYFYYLQKDGSAAVGPRIIDDQQYYFTPRGIMVVLVNADHPVPDYYKVELENFLPWHDVAAVAHEPLTRMLEDCVAAGYEYEFNSAYRSIKVQEDILWARTQEHIDIGYTPEEAYAEARRTVALPGTSEHHLGLAVDVLNVDGAEKKALDWLGEHCWEYGFILRYAEEKASITGIIYEPWHFRYVGTEVSMAMKDTGLCLEEYLGAGAVQDSTVTE